MAEEVENKEVEPTDDKNKNKEENKETRSLTEEDINKLIEAARKQEKDKLYETISSLKTEVSELTAQQKKEQQDKEKIEKDAKDVAEKERQAKMSAEDRLSEQMKKFEERLAKEATEREKLQKALDEEKIAAELDRYKHQLLEEVEEKGDKLLKELVGGKTKEEMQASVVTAKAKYQQYFDAAVTTSEGEGKKRNINEEVTNRMPKPSDPDMDPVDEEALRGLIPKIDPEASGKGEVSEEYKKNRKEILDRVAGAYGRNR